MVSSSMAGISSWLNTSTSRLSLTTTLVLAEQEWFLEDSQARESRYQTDRLTD